MSIINSLNTQITFLRDDTIRIQAVLRDFDGNLFDPDTNTVVVYDPMGTNMGTKSVTRVGAGTYYADYSIPSGGTAGVWTCDWKALAGSFPTREKIGFFVGE